MSAPTRVEVYIAHLQVDGVAALADAGLADAASFGPAVERGLADLIAGVSTPAVEGDPLSAAAAAVAAALHDLLGEAR